MYMYRYSLVNYSWYLVLFHYFGNLTYTLGIFLKIGKKCIDSIFLKCLIVQTITVYEGNFSHSTRILQWNSPLVFIDFSWFFFFNFFFLKFKFGIYVCEFNKINLIFSWEYDPIIISQKICKRKKNDILVMQKRKQQKPHANWWLIIWKNEKFSSLIGLRFYFII